MNPTSSNALRLYEVAPFHTNLQLPSNIVTYIINEQAWQDIPEQDRGIIEDVSTEATKRGVRHIMAETDVELDAMAAGGADIYLANPEERQSFIPHDGAFDPVAPRRCAIRLSLSRIPVGCSCSS